MAALAAILVVVAYNMSEWRTFRDEMRTAPRADMLVMVTTFLLTVMVDLTVALSVGMVLAAFLFMKRMSEVSNVQAISREMLDQEGDDRPEEAIQRWRGPGTQGRRGLRHQRPVLLRRGGNVLGIPGAGLGQAQGHRARPGRRPRHGFDRTAGADHAGGATDQSECARSSSWGLQAQPRELILRSPLADLVGRDRLDLTPDQAIELIKFHRLITTSRETQVPER